MYTKLPTVTDIFENNSTKESNQNQIDTRFITHYKYFAVIMKNANVT